MTWWPATPPCHRYAQSGCCVPISGQLSQYEKLSLFICFGACTVTETKQSLNRDSLTGWWNALAWHMPWLAPPMALHAHSTRSVGASWSSWSGADLNGICRATSWSSGNTFAFLETLIWLWWLNGERTIFKWLLLRFYPNRHTNTVNKCYCSCSLAFYLNIKWHKIYTFSLLSLIYSKGFDEHTLKISLQHIFFYIHKSWPIFNTLLSGPPVV